MCICRYFILFIPSAIPLKLALGFISWTSGELVTQLDANGDLGITEGVSCSQPSFIFLITLLPSVRVLCVLGVLDCIT